MSTQSMARRLDKVAAVGGGVDLSGVLEAARKRAKDWHAARNVGPVPFAPLSDLPANAPRAQRDLHAAMGAGRARVERARAQQSTQP